MAGTLELTDTLCWTPAGWIYDGILARAADSLGTDSRLGALLLGGLTTANGGYFDARSLASDDLTLLYDTIKRVAVDTKLAGPSSFAVPAGFKPHMRDLDELVEMLENAARAMRG